MPDGSDKAEAFSAALAEQHAVSEGDILRPLEEAKGHDGAVPRSDKFAIDGDNFADLRGGADVNHSLIVDLDGRWVREN